MARKFDRLFSFLTASLALRATAAAVVGAGAFVAISDSIIPAVEELQPSRFSPLQIKDPEIIATTSFIEYKLNVDDGLQGSQFGFSVAVDGSTAVVGAPGDGVNQGAAYVYSRIGEDWILQQKLLSHDGADDDHFGWDVDISGDTVVVGAYDLNDTDQGAAYVFTRDGGVWTQQQKLMPAVGSVNEQFGSSVAVSADTAMVGAFGSSGFRGAVYVFVRNGASWTEQQKLFGSDSAADDDFGWSVALSGDTAIVGAPRNQSSKGAAYVFARSGTVWIEQQKIIASDGAAFAQFGNSVAIDGETAVVGAVLDRGDMNTGSAYVFERAGTFWTQLGELSAADGAPNDKFGESVSISGDTVVVGANGRDVSGVPDQGKAYTFRRTGSAWTLQQELSPSDAAIGDNFGGSVAIANGIVVVGSHLKDFAEPTPRVLDRGAAYLFASPIEPVSVSGRVLSAQGNAVRGAKVILTDTGSGTSSIFITAQLGFFDFMNVIPGRTYRITVTSKRYRYNPQTFKVTGARSDLEFTGVE